MADQKLLGNVNNCTVVWRLLGMWGFFILCFPMAVPLGAQSLTPTPYGEEYFRLGTSSIDAAPEVVLPPSPPAQFDPRPFAAALEALELEGGPYSDALAEPLSSLARYYLGQGDYVRAEALYRRAIYVVRINDGLYSERQIPLVREILQTYRRAGDLVALDERYDYYFRLFGSGHPPFTELRLAASLEYLRWQREAFRSGLDGGSMDRLRGMYDINKRILDDLASVPGVAHHWYRELVFSQMRNLYLVQDAVEPPGDPRGYAQFKDGRAVAAQELDPKLQRLQRLRRDSRSRGATLLIGLAERTRGKQSDEELARVYLELGDWMQWNGRYVEAEKAYTEVHDLIAGNAQLLHHWLGEPTELPANGAFGHAASPDPGGQHQSVVLGALFDVSARGRVRNIVVTGATPEQDAFSGRLRKRLSRTRFRPRFLGGVPTAMEKLAREYELLVKL